MTSITSSTFAQLSGRVLVMHRDNPCTHAQYTTHSCAHIADLTSMKVGPLSAASSALAEPRWHVVPERHGHSAASCRLQPHPTAWLLPPGSQTQLLPRVGSPLTAQSPPSGDAGSSCTHHAQLTETCSLQTMLRLSVQPMMLLPADSSCHSIAGVGLWAARELPRVPLRRRCSSGWLLCAPFCC